MVTVKQKIDIDSLREDIEAQQLSLRSLFRSFGEQATPSDTLLTHMPFNVRCQNCFRQAELKTLGALNSITVKQLLARPAFGWGTLEHMLGVYTRSFETALSPATVSRRALTSAVLDWQEGDDETFEALTGANRLDRTFGGCSLGLLVLSKQAWLALNTLNVKTTTDLLALMPSQVVSCIYDGRSIATELRERLADVVEKLMLVETVQRALSVEPHACNDPHEDNKALNRAHSRLLNPGPQKRLM